MMIDPNCGYFNEERDDEYAPPYGECEECYRYDICLRAKILEELSSQDNDIDSIIFPQTVGNITYYSSEELIEWIKNQQELNKILEQEGYIKTQHTCSDKWGVPNYKFKIEKEK